MTGPRSRFTISSLMVVIAATALTLGIVLTPGFAPVLGVVVIPSTIVAIGSILLTRRVLDLVSGYRCPVCGKRGMERRAVVSFGDRFFVCPECSTRCKRKMIGTFGMFFWSDASGPEYDALYQKPAADDPWNAPPGLEDEDLIYSKTHMNLVRNKRHRRPENPNGPGLE